MGSHVGLLLGVADLEEGGKLTGGGAAEAAQQANQPAHRKRLHDREAERLHDLLAQGVEQAGERLAQGQDPRIRRIAIPAAEEQVVEVRLLVRIAHEPQPELLERGPVVQRLG